MTLYRHNAIVTLELVCLQVRKKCAFTALPALMFAHDIFALRVSMTNHIVSLHYWEHDWILSITANDAIDTAYTRGVIKASYCNGALFIKGTLFDMRESLFAHIVIIYIYARKNYTKECT